MFFLDRIEEYYSKSVNTPLQYHDNGEARHICPSDLRSHIRWLLSKEAHTEHVQLGA
jgi:hypothetical protein